MKYFKNMRNPVLPLEYHVPDSEAHVMPDGKLYIYGSFDDREDVFCSEKYHVVSTPDMEHWTVRSAEVPRDRLVEAHALYPENAGSCPGKRR